MYCPVCFTYLDPNTSVKLPCGCSNCSDCLTTWIITQTKELHYQTYEHITCMNSLCKKPFHAQDLLTQFNSEQQNNINAALLDVYLKKTTDIRACPNPACSYAGLIENQKPCPEPLICDLCDTKWREKVHLSKRERFKEYILQNAKRTELLNAIWEEIFARRCPSCGVSIQKNGGCDHMTCRRCQFEFCWLCNQQHKGHDRRFCAAAVMVRALILAIAVVNILWTIGVIQIMIAFVFWLIAFLANAFLLNILLLGLYLLKVLIVKHKKKSTYAMGAFMTGLMVMVWSSGLLWNLARAFLVELAGLGMGLAYEKRLKIWVHSVY